MSPTLAMILSSSSLARRRLISSSITSSTTRHLVCSFSTASDKCGIIQQDQDETTSSRTLRGKELRTKLTTGVSSSNGVEGGVDLRSSEENVPKKSKLWCESTMKSEEERQRKRKQQKLQKRLHNTAGKMTANDGEKDVGERKFVHFFEEVDAKMSSHQSLSKSYNNDRYRDDTILDNNDLPSSSQTNLDSFFDALHSNSSVTAHTDTTNPLNKTEPRSIFDAFPLPQKKKPNKSNPNAYNTETFQNYKKAMEEILHSPKFNKANQKRPIDPSILQPVADWLVSSETTLPYDLPALQEGISSDDSDTNISSMISPSSSSAVFSEQLQAQKNRFLAKSKLSTEQYDIALKALSILVNNCAKRARPAPLEIAWEKIKEAGMVPDDGMVNTYLYVVGTVGIGGFASMASGSWMLRDLNFDGGAMGVGTGDGGMKRSVLDILGVTGNEPVERMGVIDQDDEVEVKQREEVDLATEVAIFHDLLFEPTEKSISLRVKTLVSKGDAKGAQTLLDSFPTNDDIKLRTYLPVFKLYCKQGDVSSALKLFKRMRDTPTVRLEPENYVLIIASLAENGYFRPGAKQVEGANEIGYEYSSGPHLFDLLAAEMAEDVLEINSSSARRLYNSLVVGFQNHPMAKNLDPPIHSLAGITPRNERAQDDELVANRVAVDSNTAICPRTGTKLQLIVLEKKQRMQLHNSLLNLSNSQFERFAGGSTGGVGSRGKVEDDDYAARELATFAEWLNNREGEPFTAIVDGANVAYYMQNFDQGTFNYHQIQFMVDALEKMKENPLVVVPYKYCYRSFYVNMGSSKKQILYPKELEIVQKLLKSGKMYRVPAKCLDDYYWMLASVSDQTKSRKGIDLDVSPDNNDGRWPGTRPMLVSNDQMRDHKLELLEPRLFRRWFSCHIVNYNFTAFVNDQCVDREIGFSTADFFSREIQGNKSENGTVWHFPVSDWNLDDRFCVRIPTSA